MTKGERRYKIISIPAVVTVRVETSRDGLDPLGRPVGSEESKKKERDQPFSEKNEGRKKHREPKPNIG